jgi:hypothetical protein
MVPWFTYVPWWAGLPSVIFCTSMFFSIWQSEIGIFGYVHLDLRAFSVSLDKNFDRAGLILEKNELECERAKIS